MTMPERDRKRLAELRHEWKRWRRARPDELPFDFCLAPCAEQCGVCEGCCAAAYRAERLEQIEDEAAQIKAVALLADVLGAVVIDPDDRAASESDASDAQSAVNELPAEVWPALARGYDH